MLKYKLPDGKIVQGTTATEVVKDMAGRKLLTPRSRGGYRRDTARRVFDTYAFKIDPDSDESFIGTMVEAGLLKTTK